MFFAKKQIANAMLRLVPMGAKLVLTLYMGRFFTLEEMGTYGLVLGAVVVLSIALGQRLDYIVNHDIVGAPPSVVLQRLRDEMLVYFANHAALALGMLGLVFFSVTDVSPSILLGILVLSILENSAAAIYGHLNALNKQVFANALFFVRAGLWMFPVVGLGLYDPAFRTTQTILVWWSLCVAISLVLALWGLRTLPWREGFFAPLDKAWLKGGLRKSLPVWFSNVAFASGMYVDRFVAAQAIDMEAAGLVTFFTSFSMALYSVVQSGVIAFSGPRLVGFFKEAKEDAFWTEAKAAEKQVLWGTFALALAAEIAIPAFGALTGRPVYVEKAGLLALLLVGAWIHAWADVYYNILFARRIDRAIWLGDLLFLIPALGGNALLVSLFGIWGVGASAVLSSVFLLLWRVGHAPRRI